MIKYAATAAAACACTLIMQVGLWYLFIDGQKTAPLIPTDDSDVHKFSS